MMREWRGKEKIIELTLGVKQIFEKFKSSCDDPTFEIKPGEESRKSTCDSDRNGSGPKKGPDRGRAFREIVERRIGPIRTVIYFFLGPRSSWIRLKKSSSDASMSGKGFSIATSRGSSSSKSDSLAEGRSICSGGLEGR
jgi:hypothetical protein